MNRTWMEVNCNVTVHYLGPNLSWYYERPPRSILEKGSSRYRLTAWSWTKRLEMTCGSKYCVTCHLVDWLRLMGSAGVKTFRGVFSWKLSSSCYKHVDCMLWKLNNKYHFGICHTQTTRSSSLFASNTLCFATVVTYRALKLLFGTAGKALSDDHLLGHLHGSYSRYPSCRQLSTPR